MSTPASLAPLHQGERRNPKAAGFLEHCTSSMRHARLLLLLGTGLLLQAAAASAAAADAGAPSPELLPGQPQDCTATCTELQGQPLYEWSAGRAAAEAYVLPWNVTYAFQPLDFVALAHEVCACLEEAGSPGGGGAGPPTPQRKPGRPVWWSAARPASHALPHLARCRRGGGRRRSSTGRCIRAAQRHAPDARRRDLSLPGCAGLLLCRRALLAGTLLASTRHTLAVLVRGWDPAGLLLPPCPLSRLQPPPAGALSSLPRPPAPGLPGRTAGPCRGAGPARAAHLGAL